MSIRLGAPIQDLSVLLTKGSDFNAILRRRTGDWDDGTVITLNFSNGTTWTATIAGADATFSEDKADVNAMIADNPRKVTLLYVLGTADAVWGEGTIEVGARS